MDNEFLALSIGFMILGLAGIVLFNGPMNSLGDSCYCIIPSPEPAAAQGTSSILLVLGMMFFPMGLMKGGLPSFGRGPTLKPGPSAGPTAPVLPQAVVRPTIVSSGGLFVFGVIMTLFGVDAVLVPGYLIFENIWYEAAGALFTAAGAISMLWGLRKPKA